MYFYIVTVIIFNLLLHDKHLLRGSYFVISWHFVILLYTNELRKCSQKNADFFWVSCTSRVRFIKSYRNINIFHSIKVSVSHDFSIILKNTDPDISSYEQFISKNVASYCLLIFFCASKVWWISIFDYCSLQYLHQVKYIYKYVYILLLWLAVSAPLLQAAFKRQRSIFF